VGLAGMCALPVLSGTVGTMNQVPHVNRWVPPTDAERDAARADAEAFRAWARARAAAERDATAPARRDVLSLGPELRDVDAAMVCGCSCHPRPASMSLHDGGVTCPCQLTDAERAEARDRLFGMLAERSSEEDVAAADQLARQEAVAERLGVVIRSMGGEAPFVIRGVVDGRAFYLRERRDLWSVEIAGDESPLTDPWEAGIEVPSITVASGTSDDFDVDGGFSDVRAVEVAVDAVRTFLLRRVCNHADAQRFCPVCGVEVADADVWRISTTDHAGH
jgi:hypothetical protein